VKKWFSLLLCAMLAFSCACAEELDTPALKNPEERYAFFMSETDGSENFIYAILDAMNDEATTVEEYGAMRMDQAYYMEGQEVMRNQMLLQTCDYGRMTVTFFEDAPEEGILFTTANYNYMTMDGKLIRSDPYEDMEFDWYWESFRFPYGRLQTMNGVRQDEDGNSYFFITSDETMCFEYAVTPEMIIEELRIYVGDENGDLVLVSVVKYSTCEAKEVPPEVLAAMAENEPPQAAHAETEDLDEI